MHLNNYKVTSKLLSWYKENQRVLPWRGQNDAYIIWLSEIIMQQTRVVQGTPYYLKFVENYPDVEQLARADEQEILKLWQGLGYYSRARNLHSAAKTIVREYKGIFPSNYNDIIKLKGIGSYTAAAIASIAFNKPHAVLDGNVYRVLSRLYAITLPINANGAKIIYQKYADNLLDKKQPGTFNEAIMEFGATLCLPKNPLCQICPINEYCEAKKQGMQEQLPFKNALKPVKSRYFHYLLIKKGNSFYLKLRPSGDIWQGLYDLPLIEKSNSILLTEQEVQDNLEIVAVLIKPIKRLRHKLTHQHLEVVFYEIEIRENSSILETEAVIVNHDTLIQYPLPKPIELFLNDYLCNPKLW